jgi:hypothetical protein
MSTRSSRTESGSSAKSEFEIAFDAMIALTTSRTKIPGRDHGVLKYALRSREEEKKLREAMREVRIRMAGAIAKDVHRYASAPVFSKPASLPTFLEIRRTLDRVRLSRKDPEKQPEKSRSIIRTYNAWLKVILDAQARDLGNIELLLDTIEILEDAQHGHPLARAIEDHVRNEFHIELPDPVEWPAKSEVAIRARWVRRLVHREDVIPMWLLDGLPIPDGLEDDDDDDEEESEEDQFKEKTGELF